MNILLELQQRRISQVESWRQELPGRFAESRVWDNWCKMNSTAIIQRRVVLEGTIATAEIVFSKDGQWMASGHNNHKIYVFQTLPHLSITRTLAIDGYHTRTPWRLAFDPTNSSILISGCLGGVVCKWNTQSGEVLERWVSSVQSPITSLVFSPSSPELLYVSCGCGLYLLSAHSLATVWETRTSSLHLNVRLLLHHPLEDRLLTVITNPPERSSMLLHMPVVSSSTYRVQMHHCSGGPLDLTDKKHHCLCERAVVNTSNAVALTASYVVLCERHFQYFALNFYSILEESFGIFLQTVPIDHAGSLCMDLSHFGSVLLIGLETNLLTVKITVETGKKTPVHATSSSQLPQMLHRTNTIRWLPLTCTGSGVVVGDNSGRVHCIQWEPQ